MGNNIKLKCWEGENIPLEAAKLPAAGSFWLGWFFNYYAHDNSVLQSVQDDDVQ